MPIGSNSTSTSPTRFNDNSSNSNANGASDRKNSLDSNSSSGSGGGGKLATMSYDPTSYIQRARVTRPAPPKPSCNPMQFVQIKPCNLYQTAQEQLKKAEEVKKVKEIKKEEPEDWQSNLDNWKSSRRKRVEHIIDRVVEVKKLELEEHDRTRRKSKTFSEMLEERSSRRTKLASLSVYTEDESNDLSDFGIGTSSTSGKSSLSEDYDNHSVMSDNVDTEKSTSDLLINHHHHHHHHHHHNHHHHHQHDNNDQLNHDENGMSRNRDYISSPGYETSSSTAPTNSPDPFEYTYEGAIQDYKTRISRAQSNNNNTNNGFNRSTVSSPYSKDSTPERNMTETNNYTPSSTTKRLSGTKIENRLTNFELKSSSSSSATSTNDLSVPKKDLPKVDILKRRELFEKDNSNNASTESISSVGNNQKRLSGDFTTTKSIRERLSNLEKRPTIEQECKQKTNRLSGDITSLKDRLQNLERQTSVIEKNPKIDVPVVPLKDRLSSLQSAVQKEEIKKPVLLVDEHQLEILKKEELEKQHILRKEMLDDDNLSSSQEILNLQDESNVDTDREDSGIHTTDVSCSVSQTDEQPDLVNEESHHHINAEDGLCQNIDRQLQNTSENHDKCEESTPCVPDVIRNSTNEPMSPNKLIDDQQQQQQQQSPDDQNVNTTSPEPLVDQEASVEEALEIALRAIDNENFHDNNNNDDQSCTTKMNNLKIYQNHINDEDKIIDDMKMNEKCTTTKNIIKNLNNSKENFESIYENLNEMIIISNNKIEQNEIESSTSSSSSSSSSSTTTTTTTTDMSKNQIHLDEKQIIQTKNQNVKNYSDDHHQHDGNVVNQNGNVAKHANHEAKIEELKSELEQKENYVDNEQYYQVPKSSEPLYEVPKFQKPIPVYENIEIFYSDLTTIVNGNITNGINNEENQIEIENYHQLNGLVTTSSTPTSSSSSSSSMLLQPPKEKPPPPPIEEISDNENEIESITQNKTDALSSLSTSSSLSPIKQDNTNQQQQKSLNNLKITEESINIFENVGSKQNSIKRMNSTKRIKKELRNKRSSFLGIEGNDDDIFLELTVAPPPDMAQLLQEERRLEKQLYMKAGLYDSSDTGESRDSGVSENHSRQSSEPFTNSSEEHEDLLMKKEKEIIEVLEKEKKKQRISSENWSKQDENDAKIQCIENQIREQEEVLRVERELLQLEQEELKRQRENLMIRENMARRELEHGAKMLMSATNNHNRSLQDINNASTTTTTTTTTNHYANIPNQIYRVEADYRKSMSDLPSDLLFNSKRIPPTPPAKPLRSNLSIDSRILNANGNTNNNKNNNTVVGLIKIANVGNNQMMTGSSGRIQHSQSTDEFVPLRNYQPSSALHHGNMTRHTLHALSATPKPKYTDGWVQATIKNKSSSDKCVDNWLSYQQKRKSIPDGFNYNKHWLIQEAEQRRIDQQRGLRSSSISISTNSINGWANTNSNSAIQRNGSITNDKPLPDAVIETITQRVQSKGLGERKRLDQTPPPPPIPAMAASDSLLTTVTAAAPPPPPPPPPAPASATTEVGQQDKILSVSGKKKCSHCGEELGRGAAMIIESLRLFYHINCFKCCVCHVQLGDGLNGTDVRVRNHKLHCHNCYSSDDGIKFSCV